MLTGEDIIKIKKALSEEIVFRLDEKLGLESGQSLDDKLSHLPSKDQFYEENDKLMGELKAIREEQSLITDQYKRSFDEIEELKKIHPNNTHIFAN